MVSFIPSLSDISSRFPFVETIYYGKERSDGIIPNGPEIELTAAQFRAINTTPQTIISAITNRTIIPRLIHMRKEAGSAGFVAGANTGVQFRLTSGTGVQVSGNISLASLRFDQTTEESELYICPASTNLYTAYNLSNTTIIGQSLVIFGATADMTSDGSPVHISVLAELWPISLG